MTGRYLDGFTPWPEALAAHYRAQGYWRGEPLDRMLAVGAAAHGDRVALVCGARRWSYRELDERASRLAAGLLQLGVRPRDRVIVQLPNIAEFFSTVFALFRMGAVPVFALPAHRRAELSYFARHAEAVACIIPDREAGFDHRTLLQSVQAEVPTLRHVIVAGEAGPFVALDALDIDPVPLPPVDPADVAFLQLSGGSTGLPKLIPRTHDDYYYSVRESAAICGLGRDTVYLCALPAAHNFPLSSPGTLGVLHAGGRVVMARRAAPDEAFPLIAAEGVTDTALVPPLAMVWLESAAATPHDLSSLRVLQVGGAKLAPEVAARIGSGLGCRLQQVFGMAEGLVNYTRGDDPLERVLTTQGRAISPADEVRVVDDEDRDVAPGQVGHLLTRGPYTIRGYYRAPEHNQRAFTSDGFYRTGDLVRRLPSGHLVVEGRAKDQINRGGDKVAAEEVENHLLAHPAVHDAALVAMPDAFLGEKTCAFVVPRGDAPRSQDLARFLRERGLAAFKIPDRIEFVTQFPKTGVGKVNKRALRESFITP